MAKFSILIFEPLRFGHVSYEAKSSASIIGPTCAFESKNYKNVGHIITVSACVILNKKIFQIPDFCSVLPSLLVEKFPKIVISQ